MFCQNFYPFVSLPLQLEIDAEELNSYFSSILILSPLEVATGSVFLLEILVRVSYNEKIEDKTYSLNR